MRFKTKISKQISEQTGKLIIFVCDYFNISNLKARNTKESDARRMIVGLLKERYEENISFEFIAKKLGYCFPQSAVNANKRCKELRKVDKDFSMTYQIIASLCQEK